MTRTLLLRLLFGAALLSLAACAIPATQPAADPVFSARAKAATVDPDKARLYAFLGENRTPFLISLAKRTPSDLYINGIIVGGLNRGECLVLDLKPGTYSLSWVDRTTDAGPMRSGAHMVTLSAGHAVYISLDTEHHVAEMFGAVGQMLDPPTGDIKEHPQDGQATVAAMKIVLPDKLAVTLIHPIGMPAGS